MKTELLPSVFVMNLSYTGLAIARAFARTGIRVYGIGSKRWAYGNFSRFVDFFHSPDSLNQREQLTRFLIDLARKEPVKPLIFPTRDHDIIFLRDYRYLLEQYFTYTIPSNKTLELVLNKWELHNALVSCGVPTPRTQLVENAEELAKIGTSINYPVLVKPVYAADWRKDSISRAVENRKAIISNRYSDLLSVCARFQHLVPSFLLQEYIDGEDTDIFTFCSHCNKDSEILASFNTRKLRQVPEKLGTGVLVQSAVNDAIAQRSERLLKHIGFSGVSEIEYKRDLKTNEYYLIEINPRFWDQHQLSNSFGLNLPLIAYNDIVAKNVPPREAGFSQTTWIAEDAFLQLLLNKLLKEPKQVLELLKEVTGSNCYAVWDISDPLPFVVCMQRQLFGIFNRLYRSFLG